MDGGVGSVSLFAFFCMDQLLEDGVANSTVMQSMAGSAFAFGADREICFC